MQVNLWPRLEVLQLVIPSFGHINRGLHSSIVIDAIRHLHTHPSITFDRWLVTAKSILKWNDSCIKLFWDMLCMAVLYVDKKSVANEESIQLEYVVIFLLLHVVDPLVRPSPSPSQYETMWPSAMDIDQISPASPSSKRIHLSNSPPSSPPALSPRSAKNFASTPKYSKTSSQHLQALRRKLPLIVTTLACDVSSLDELKNSRDDFIVDLQTLHLENPGNNQLNMITRKMLDSLKLIIGGGTSNESEINSISSLHPLYNSKPFDAPVQTCSEIMIWLEENLCSNEVFYPSGIYNPSSPKQSLSSTSSSNKIFFPPPNMTDAAIGSIVSPQVIDDYGSNTLSSPRYIASQTATQQPQRILYPMSSLSKANATLVHGCNSSTYIHIVTDDIAVPTSPGIMHLQSTSEDDRNDIVHLIGKQDNNSDKMQISSGALDILMSEGDSPEISEKYLAIRIPKSIDSFSQETVNRLANLPTLSVASCVKSTIYTLSPYSAGTISSCRETEIIVGAVSGVVVMIGCEKVKLSVVCRKLIIYNCVECEIYIANLSPTVIIGDSRSLSFAPYNVVYRSLRAHLSYAALEGLVNSHSWDSSVSLTAPAYACDQVVNHWSVLCDVNLCLEATITAASPSGYAIDTMKEGVIVLPTPSASTANILPLEKFTFAAIPYRNEYISAERSAIPLPPPHRDSLHNRRKKAMMVQKQLQELIAEGSDFSKEPLLSSDDKEQALAESLGTITAISPILSRKFMDWLVRSGKINEVVDLIRIDAESVKSIHTNAEDPEVK